MKKIVLLWSFLLVCFYGQAQDVGSVDPLNDINAIKRDTSFIYAEATMIDAVEAQSGARAVLELKLYDWLRSKYPSENVDSLVAQSKGKWRDLLTRRGKYNRVFVFVNKQKVLPEVVLPDPMEEVQIPIEEELTADEEVLTGILRFSGIEPYIKDLKNQERLLSYGKYATLPDNVSCYLFIYDRDGAVVSVLRQGEDGSYFNLREKRDDHVRNYKNCGAIWFQFKEGLNVE